MRAAAWLAAAPGNEALLIATALAGDDEMAARIARHRADRAQRVPGLRTLEVPRALPQALREGAAPQRLLVVDCLTLWLTQWMMPPPGWPAGDPADALDDLVAAAQQTQGPLVLVSNEIGLGVLPVSREARAVVDELGRLHQQLARHCARVTLMVAGLELTLKAVTQKG